MSMKYIDTVWIHQSFLKDKIKVRERYWRNVHEILDIPVKQKTSNIADNNNNFDDNEPPLIWIIPDGFVWRKYLSMLYYLIDKKHTRSCGWMLLESAVEVMDWRNMSPSIKINSENYDDENVINFISESAAIQERSKLQNLIQKYPNLVIPFCDSSVRDDDYDEWDYLNYETMTISDRGLHSLLRAANMVKSHNVELNVYVLCADLEFCTKFQSEDGVHIMYVEDFIPFLLKHNLLTDTTQEKIEALKEKCHQEYQTRNKPPNNVVDDSSKNQNYIMTDAEIETGTKNGSLMRGRLDVTKENPKEGFVKSDGQQYYINQLIGHFNQAFHQDIVIIQPLPESQWGRPVGRRRLVHHRDDDDDDGEDETQFINDTPPVPSARVVAIANQSRRLFVATMVDTPSNDESTFLVTPMDVRIPKVRIKSSSWKKFVSKRLLIEVDGWEVGHNYPHGRCVKILGDIAHLETEISCLLHENEVDLEPFSAAALACLPAQGTAWKIPKEEFSKRRDLRKSHRIFSVDPPGCQDIDDTMHAQVLDNGDIEVGVHIADVTYFVPHNCPLDKEAQVRGTTFYLVDRRFDMLPSLLSSDLCSLHGNKDRLAVSVIWVLSKDLKTVKSVWYGRTIIHNCQAMTYDQAHNMLHRKPPDSPDTPSPPPLTAGYPVDPANIKPLTEDLNILTRLARILRKRREDEGGAVDLSSGDLGGELKFTLDKDNNPIRVKPKQDLEIHHTIAEMMILANTYVASKIKERFPNLALLRIHRAVEEERFEDLKEILTAGNISHDVSSNKSLAQSLKQAETGFKAGAVVNSLFKSLATRAMTEALYVCSGDMETEESLSHYGLGLDVYTHFTSPIRRYADVIVHKELLASIVGVLKPWAPNKKSIGPIRTDGLASLPGSKTISVLGGEGLKDASSVVSAHEVLTSNNSDIQETTNVGSVTLQQNDNSLEKFHDHNESTIAPYEAKEVTRICEGLNRHNRMAKISSMECQTLFLSLYFRDNLEITEAVITNLRENGLWVYVPKFDFRAPVYLSDKLGNVQLDPKLLGLPSSVGLPSTSGFAASESCRYIPSGSCSLLNSPDQHLLITVTETERRLSFRILDVVTVMISCDDWDVRARIPKPRLHLVATTSRAKGKNTKQQKQGQLQEMKPFATNIENSTSCKSNVQTKQRINNDTIQKLQYRPLKHSSLYDALNTIETPPILKDVPVRSKQRNYNNQTSSKSTEVVTNRNELMRGRIVIGGFVNPDTHLATQEAAMEAAADAAAKRRAQVIENRSRDNEYGSTRSYEREATARMQKLAAEKRNARKSKAR